MAASRPNLWLAVVAAAVLAAGASPARSQNIGQQALSYLSTYAYIDGLKTWDDAKNLSAESVQEHTRGGYIPNGLVLPGGHALNSSVTASTLYDDNLLQGSQKVGDLVSTIAGNSVLQSNLSQHMFRLTSAAALVDYKDHTSFNHADGLLKGEWRLDLDAADSIGGSFETDYGHNVNFLPADPVNVAAAVPVWTNRAEIGYMHDAGRTSLAVGADYQRTLLYDVPTYGGAIADEASGNNDLAGGFVLMNYRWSPGYTAFVAGRIDRQMMLNANSTYGDNSLYSTEAGFKYEINPLLQFSFFGGYQYLKFDSDSQYNTAATTFKGTLRWLPMRRMTVTLDASRNIQRSVTGPDFGEIANTFDAQMQYDIYHNIFATLDLTLQQNQFIGGTRIDNVWKAGGSLDYLFNENLALTLSYQHIDQASNTDGQSFNDNRYMAALKLSQ